MRSSGGLDRRRVSCERPTPIEQMPLLPTTDHPKDLVASSEFRRMQAIPWRGGISASDRRVVAAFLRNPGTPYTVAPLRRRSLDFAHIPMMYGRHVPVIPSNCDRVPTRFRNTAAVVGIAPPINAAALLEGLRFGGIHVRLSLRDVWVALLRPS